MYFNGSTYIITDADVGSYCDSSVLSTSQAKSYTCKRIDFARMSKESNNCPKEVNAIYMEVSQLFVKDCHI